MASEAEYQKFRDNYKSRFKSEPNNNAAMAYDAITLLDKILSSCADNDLDCVLRGFAGLGKYSGVGGTLIIDKHRNPLRPFGLKEVKGGQYVWIQRQLPLQ